MEYLFSLVIINDSLNVKVYYIKISNIKRSLLITKDVLRSPIYIAKKMSRDKINGGCFFYVLHLL